MELSVSVDAVPTAGLIRPAIEAALAGRAFPDGAEAAIARAVADAVRVARSDESAEPGGQSC
jgi:hypothetical protein